MANITTEKAEVRVGSWLPDQTFLGEVLRFSAEELGSWTEWPEIQGEHRAKLYTLYRTPDGEYRIHVLRWSRWCGEGSRAWLEPTLAPEDIGPAEEIPVYETYSEEQAQRIYPKLFAALGMPKVRDLD
jgi:hypothetical protein